MDRRKFLAKSSAITMAAVVAGPFEGPLTRRYRESPQQGMGTVHSALCQT